MEFEKQSLRSEVMIILKSTKFQRFFENDHTVFKILSKLYLELIHYKKIKWICVEISMVHRLHQIHENIYIFNKIFKEYKLAQLRGLLGVKDMVSQQLPFVPSHFFMQCNLNGVVPMRLYLFPHFFRVSFLYALYNGYLTWPLLSGPIHHVHPSSVQGGCWRYYTLTYNYFPKFDSPMFRTLPQMRIFTHA